MLNQLDLPKPETLRDGDGLVLEDGAIVCVAGLPEPLLEISARTPLALVQLAWHLGNRHTDVQIVGDRFVFQSEVLFPSGSAELQPSGEKQLANVAQRLLEISAKIPKDINWVLQVDGHTDSKPINTRQFPSNWELSSARAIAVVKFLNSQGIPNANLVAAGYGARLVPGHPLS